MGRKSLAQIREETPVKVLAVNIYGDMTWCEAPPSQRGKGRCNHVFHQEDNETGEQFCQKIEKLREEGAFVSRREEHETFISSKGTTINKKPYRMTEDEKKELTKIESRLQLDKNIEGGYIELETRLWNDMDKSYFSNMSGIPVKNITAVLHGDAVIITNSDNDKFPEGKVIFPTSIKQTKIDENGNEIEESTETYNIPDGVKYETGVEGMNNYAESCGFEATKDIYVLPYYMRRGMDDIDSDLTIGYKYLLRNHKNPDKQQLAYEALLDNDSLKEKDARWNDGYRNKSLKDEFVGKGGIFRACLSGGSIPYSARTVITPTTDMNYGEIKIPPSAAVDIFRPTLISQMTSEGKTEDEINEYFKKCRVPQTEVDPEIRKDLERRIADRRVLMERAPALHMQNLQCYVPKISDNASTQIHPLYCKGYNADFDGDAVPLYGINAPDICEIADKELGADKFINTHTPRAISERSILPSKDSLWGLINILDRRN